MKLTRFEILLPLAYNDGAAVEPELFLLTHEELLTRFGATTVDTVIAKGSWVYGGVRYDDRLRRFRIDTDDSPAVRAFFADFKARLKERFRQHDIWITASAIEVL
jgi:hypothetical protein